MSKLTDRLEKLSEFGKRQEDFKARFAALEAEMQQSDREFDEFLKNDLGITGQVHLSEVLKTTLESTYEPNESKLIL